VEILEGEIRWASCDRAAWAAAIEAFDGKRLSRENYVAEWGWIAAGLFNKHDQLTDDWHKALTTVVNADNRGVMFARYQDMGHIVEWCYDGSRVVTTTVQCDVIAGQIAEDAFCEIHLGAPNDAWRLLARALPPIFKTPSSTDVATKTELDIEFAEWPSDPKASHALLEAALHNDPIVNSAVDASQAVFVTALIGDEERTFAWFPAAESSDQPAIFYRIGADGIFQVGSSDCRKVIEPMIFATPSFEDIHIDEEPEPEW